MDTRYRVVRPNGGLPPLGTILTDKDFVTSRRAQQLTEQRYILPLSGDSTVSVSVQDKEAVNGKTP